MVIRPVRAQGTARSSTCHHRSQYGPFPGQTTGYFRQPMNRHMLHASARCATLSDRWRGAQPAPRSAARVWRRGGRLVGRPLSGHRRQHVWDVAALHAPPALRQESLVGLVCQSDFQSRGVARVDQSHQNAAAALRGTSRTWPCWMRSSQPTFTMAGVHRVAALVQGWLLETHDGAVQPAHLDAYLNEFVFRINGQIPNFRGLLVYRLLQPAMQTSPCRSAS